MLTATSNRLVRFGKSLLRRGHIAMVGGLALATLMVAGTQANADRVVFRFTGGEWSHGRHAGWHRYWGGPTIGFYYAPTPVYIVPGYDDPSYYSGSDFWYSDPSFGLSLNFGSDGYDGDGYSHGRYYRSDDRYADGDRYRHDGGYFRGERDRAYSGDRNYGSDHNYGGDRNYGGNHNYSGDRNYGNGYSHTGGSYHGGGDRYSGGSYHGGGDRYSGGGSARYGNGYHNHQGSTDRGSFRSDRGR